MSVKLFVTDLDGTLLPGGKTVSPENIRAVADLATFNESTGTYMPQVRVYVDGFTDVGAIGENTISIEIRKVS